MSELLEFLRLAAPGAMPYVYLGLFVAFLVTSYITVHVTLALLVQRLRAGHAGLEARVVALEQGVEALKDMDAQQDQEIRSVREQSARTEGMFTLLFAKMIALPADVRREVEASREQPPTGHR